MSDAGSTGQMEDFMARDRRDGFAKPHNEDEFVDEVRIKIEERYKTSDMSGDEWRFHAVLTFWRKGKQVHERRFRSIRDALAAAPWQWMVWKEECQEPGLLNDPKRDQMCFQPGCTAEGGPKMFLLQEWSERGEGPLPQGSFPHFRRFCDKHAKRGDCAFEDADDNYSPMPPEPKP